jgi:hypothetical protein
MTRDKMDNSDSPFSPTTTTSLMSAGIGKIRERVKVTEQRPVSQATPVFSQPEVKAQPVKAAPPRKSLFNI